MPITDQLPVSLALPSPRTPGGSLTLPVAGGAGVRSCRLGAHHEEPGPGNLEEQLASGRLPLRKRGVCVKGPKAAAAQSVVAGPVAALNLSLLKGRWRANRPQLRDTPTPGPEQGTEAGTEAHLKKRREPPPAATVLMSSCGTWMLMPAVVASKMCSYSPA